MNPPSNPSTPPDPEPRQPNRAHQASALSMHSRTGPTSPDDRAAGALVDIASPAGLIQGLEDVALLLHQASLEAWETGDDEGLTSQMHYLGLGAYLAQGNTVALLPEHHVLSHNWPPYGPPAENDPTKLVASAQHRLRCIAPNALPGLSDLVLEVCDLAREFREHTKRDRLDRIDLLDRTGQAEKAGRHES